MNTKTLSAVTVKDAEQGTVEALFSTYDVVDSHGDVVRRGAFNDGAEVVISAYGHGSWSGMLPVGKGTIHDTADGAVLRGQFFMDTEAGRETFAVVKELEGLQEWSYSLQDVDWESGELDGQDVRFLNKIAVKEVSPVLSGAGVNTRTLMVKSDLRFADHADAVLADVELLIGRAEDVVALRAQKGKTIADESAEQLTRLGVLLDRIKALLSGPPRHDDELSREYARFIKTTRS